MKKEYIIINGKKYQKANDNLSAIISGFALIGIISFLLVGSVGTAVLALLGLA